MPERDLVLQKQVRPVQTLVGREKGLNGRIGDAITRVAVAATHQQRVAFKRNKTVLQVNIENIEALSKDSWVVAKRMVVVRLRNQPRLICERLDKTARADFRHECLGATAPDRLAAVDVALHRVAAR